MSLSQSQSLLNELIELIDSSINNFNDNIPAIERTIFNKVQLSLKDLDLFRGNVKPTIKNLRTINRLKREIEQAILNKKYLNSVSKFEDAFGKVTKLQTQYFASLEAGFEIPAFIGQLQKSSIAASTEALTQAGIKANIAEKAADLIRRNITEGASFSNLNNEMREFLTKTETGVGELSRYSSVITTDALNTYAGEYNQIVSDDLGFEWFIYAGALVEHSRDFCEALVKKKWLHISEFSRITKGKINGKTVSLQGVKKGTNAVNFRSLRGGWNCNHLVSPISTEFVPQSIRKKHD